MSARAPAAVRIAVGFLAGLAGALALVTVWHRAGWVTKPVSASYPYTEYITQCAGAAFAGAFFILNVVLGLLLRRAWPIALGMISPLAFALAAELHRDPTSHNLFPFEIVMMWVPAFGVAWLGAWLGKRIVTGRATPPVIPPGQP